MTRWDPANTYISDDGQWIILEVGADPDVHPNIRNFTGSVTVAASSHPNDSGSGDTCQFGYSPYQPYGSS